MAVKRSYEHIVESKNNPDLIFDCIWYVDPENGVEIESIKLKGIDVTAAFAGTTHIEDSIEIDYKNGDWDY